MHSKRIQEKVKEDYNRIAHGFSDTRQHSWPVFQRFLPYFSPHSSVLDMGCGNGRLLFFLKEQGYKDYLGVDQSGGLLKFARKQFPKEHFLCQDMSKPLSGVKKWDALFAISSFHHLPPHEQVKTLKLWKSYLKKGGKLFMVNWNLHQPRFWKAWVKMPFRGYGWRGILVPWKNETNRYYYAFTLLRMRKLLTRAGFKVIKNCWVLKENDSSLFQADHLLSIAEA